jgi:hypothetical protein
MPKPPSREREPKASRIRVWQAVEQIVQSGRRPTVEGVRERLGGGSPNSVTAYINEWYQELGSRLTSADAPALGLPREALTLLTELWRVAAAPRVNAESSGAAAELRDAERGALVAEVKALEALNKELARHRASAEKALAETRAMLVRAEAARDDEQSRASMLDQELAQLRLELEITRVRETLSGGRRRRPRATAVVRTRRKRGGKARPTGSKRKAHVTPRHKAASTAAKRRPRGRRRRVR